MVKLHIVPCCWLALSCTGCGVKAAGTDSGGVSDSPAPGCPAGLTVLMSDYVSTQVALSDLTGKTRSASLVSTASTKTSGLSFALSGDVVLPGTPPASGSVVLIDRFGSDVLTWVDPASGEVLGQLPIATGFESNPQDYLEVDARRAFVSRWGQNGNPGRESFDRGGDLLVIDIASREISNAIEMPIVDGLPPRPGGLLSDGSDVIVSLDPIAPDFATTGFAMLVGVSIEDEAIDWQMTLEGVKSCGRPARSPNGRLLALACSGALDPEGQVQSVEESALLLFDARTSPPEELERYSVSDLLEDPLQADVEFANDHVVLLKTQTALSADGDNRWFAFDLDDETSLELARAGRDAQGHGKGLVYGSMVCAGSCSKICLLADADRGVLQRVEVTDAIEVLDPVRVEDRVGLPPRGLLLRE